MTDWKTALNWRAQLEAIIQAVPPDQLCDLAGELAKYQARIILSLNTSTQPAAKPSEFLTAKEAAALCKCSVQFVYDHAAYLGGAQIGNGQRRPWRFRRRDVIAFVEREGL